MPPLTRLEALKISELSGVDFPANGADGWMVLKQRDLIDDDGELTPAGAKVVLDGLADGKLTPEDVLTAEELAKARRMQPRPFLKSFGAVRPPGMG
jgi:hypothetical protein